MQQESRETPVTHVDRQEKNKRVVVVVMVYKFVANGGMRIKKGAGHTNSNNKIYVYAAGALCAP